MSEETNKATILIVDDTVENLQLLVELLSPNYQVQAAKKGSMALKIAQSKTPPDIILLDIMMPELDGYQVCELLKSDPRTRHIPVIFLTAKSQIDDEVKGLQLGAVDYITKPISPPIVEIRVKTHLALQNTHRLLEDKVKQRTNELYQTRLKIIQRLGRAAEYKDNETGMHVIRMSKYSRLLASAAGFSEIEAERLMNAAPMHDIGKIGIADDILKKPGRLTPEQFEIMKQHPQIGADIIGDDKDELLSMAKVVALTHHEKWDGSGYPKGLSGEAIPLVGRIVAIADVFDALTSTRPYKTAWPIDKTIALLEDNAGKHFDPNLIPIFINLLPQLLEIKAQYSE